MSNPALDREAKRRLAVIRHAAEGQARGACFGSTGSGSSGLHDRTSASGAPMDGLAWNSTLDLVSSMDAVSSEACTETSW